MPTMYPPRPIQNDPHRKLKRKDGLIVPWNPILAKEPGFEEYIEPQKKRKSK